MFYFRIKLHNYIKYFVLAVGLGMFGETYCGELFKKGSSYDYVSLKKIFGFKKKNSKAPEKISIPWSDSRNCIIGGWKFWGIIRDFNGKELTQDDLKEQVVILVFSTTWCPNCPQAIQQLDQLKSRLLAIDVDNVRIIHLNIGDESFDDVKKHLKHINVSLDAWQSIPSDAVEISVIPSVLIFNKKGEKVCGYIGGGFNYLSDEFVKFIVALSRQ